VKKQVRSPLLTRGRDSRYVDKKYGQIHDFAVNQYKQVLGDVQNIPRRATDMIKEAGTSTTQFAMKLLAKSKEFGSDPGLYKMGTAFLLDCQHSEVH
jgi:hypothetical protein